ncbi:hypothetical protein CC80DRAFT_550017 [Byssothecium circinans]|uniref:Uncharacterized protein n=1 Tax=Byssothecium circinans TaxID=147558 RepID=A0A6A5TQB5_9PLEO|nr:hypothetical protein CC80DRAFT_550017 [Byssothecium circinans]
MESSNVKSRGVKRTRAEDDSGSAYSALPASDTTKAQDPAMAKPADASEDEEQPRKKRVRKDKPKGTPLARTDASEAQASSLPAIPDANVPDRYVQYPTVQGSESIPADRLRLVEDYIFRGKILKDIVEAFKKEGVTDANGNVVNLVDKTKASREVKKHGAMYFSEQNARRPWGMLTNEEKSNARANGLNAKDYKLHREGHQNEDGPLTTGHMNVAQALVNPSAQYQNAHAAANPPQKKPKARAPAPKAKKTTVARPVAKEKEHDSKTNVETNASITAGGKETMATRADEQRTAELPRFKQPLFQEADRIYAAANTVGNKIEIFAGDITMPMYVRVEALQKYCAYFKDWTKEKFDLYEIGFPETSPTVMRAFIACISPIPRGKLPETLVTFNNLSPEFDARDRFGIFNLDDNDDITVEVMEWNIDQCIELHRLAVHMHCSIVKDMATDRIRSLYHDWINKGGYLKLDLQALKSDLRWIKELFKEEDKPFLRIWSEMLCHRSNLSKQDWLEYGDHAWEAICEARTNSAQVIGSENICERYHSHGSEPCFKTFDTAQTIEDVAMEICERISEEVAKKVVDGIVALQRNGTIAEGDKEKIKAEAESIDLALEHESLAMKSRYDYMEARRMKSLDLGKLVPASDKWYIRDEASGEFVMHVPREDLIKQAIPPIQPVFCYNEGVSCICISGYRRHDHPAANSPNGDPRPPKKRPRTKKEQDTPVENSATAVPPLPDVPDAHLPDRSVPYPTTVTSSKLDMHRLELVEQYLFRNQKLDGIVEDVKKRSISDLGTRGSANRKIHEYGA